ncbi:putative zinc-finger double-stranded RNA-binding [Lyophyllum shimeji]|uniref:Zinc-finger double-stranded RNA-binding n=1 Tax=Lyophyllum shimeji TaxID=47721 RepID=A0A9P3ULF5_LYOSH|nr:putative zinc-finger double-stranded RNA-binding [Lyophyllum shimeji]
MADKGGAYGTKASDTDFRKKWDKEEYAERARKKDQEEKERMQENENRMKQGKKPLKGRRDDLPKPTELMKQREAPLELDKNLGKTMVVQNPGGRGPGQPGFYCEACNRTYKDSVGYLDHINSRAHLRVLGQTTRVARSTLAQVQARIAFLREKTKAASAAKAFDFDQRLAEVKAKEAALREQKKAAKKAEKEKARLELINDTAVDQDDDMSKLMGFGGFGTTKK